MNEISGRSHQTFAGDFGPNKRSIYLSIYLSTYLPIYIYLYIYISIYTYAYVLTHLRNVTPKMG